MLLASLLIIWLSLAVTWLVSIAVLGLVLGVTSWQTWVGVVLASLLAVRLILAVTGLVSFAVFDLEVVLAG